ncbi:uncharacterized protein IUM83_06103 [Phytophthora cinnamomi]|uniref:uncharacterized protein n=1 Tax=Phytophthora cinnamomi TaxID=4785 RepID=UPI003559FB2A|nr:hypothetical protein IUM83_06103 [Phytophthora cinnamomi]
MYSTINPIPCTVTTPCVEEMGVQGNSTRYDFCHYTQDEYLKDAYGDTPATTASTTHCRFSSAQMAL